MTSSVAPDTADYYGYDGLGSVRVLIQGSGQAWAFGDTYVYDAFGIQLNAAGSTPNSYRYTGEQWDPDLGLYYLRARYGNPADGRFLTMDTFEGNNSDPLSLHKYLYCHANPVNGTDPSRHDLITTLSASTWQTGLRGSQAPAIALPGHIAARGFMKWAWLAGGIGAGVATIMEDTELWIETQTQLSSNPTGSQFAYKIFECDSFARDAETYFRSRGKNPQKIYFQAHPIAIARDEIKADLGYSSEQIISESGYHEGTLVDGRVYEGNLPFGVVREKWERAYSLRPMGSDSRLNLREAFNRDLGVLSPP